MAGQRGKSEDWPGRSAAHAREPHGAAGGEGGGCLSCGVGAVLKAGRLMGLENNEHSVEI